jgi:tetratricopeptide (TPR) repeat protein
MAGRCAKSTAIANPELPILDDRRRVIRKSGAGPRRAIVLLLVQAAIAVHVAHWMSTGRTLSPLEPSESMQFSKSGVVNAGLVFFALSIGSTLLLGRWFCGWGCHVVALQDGSRWLLSKIGVRPRAVNLGILGAVPWIAFVYMFLAPIVQRLLRGVAPAAATLHLTTGSFWETFPSLPVAIATFLVCGFAAVYLLGSKGFCTYGCPYGGIFGVADQLSPFRILVNENCEGCGHCTAVCTSNVRVHEEVRDYGAVVDPGCMKCLDCVSVCPKDALRVGFGAPALFASRRTEPAGPKPGFGSTLADLLLLGAFFVGAYAVLLDFDTDLQKIQGVAALLAVLTALSLVVAALFRARSQRPREHSRAEEALLGGFFLLALYAFRGYRNSVPLLFALGLSSILAYVAVSGLRLLYRKQVKLQGHVLRAAGRWTAAGTLFAGALLPLGGFWGYAAWSRRALREAYAQGVGYAGAGAMDQALPALLRAVELDPGYHDVQEKYASLLADAGRFDEAIVQFRAAIARKPDRPETHALLGLALFQNGAGPEARKELERAIEIAPKSPDLHDMLAEVCSGLGDEECAKAHQLEAGRLRAEAGG